MTNVLTKSEKEHVESSFISIHEILVIVIEPNLIIDNQLKKNKNRSKSSNSHMIFPIVNLINKN